MNLRFISWAMQTRLVSWLPWLIVGIGLIALPTVADNYVKSMITKALILTVFAMSLNLLWGYCGLFSLGHAAFFGAGAYAVGILWTRYHVESLWLVSLGATLTAMLIAAIFGIVALRMSLVYFLLVTFAMGQLLYSVALKWTWITGGSNGLPGIPYPDLGLPGFVMDATSFYYLAFATCVVCIFLLSRVANSPFGCALQGIRGDERRMECLGYHTWLYKYLAYIVAALFAGIAGVLFAFHNGIVGPEYVGVQTSTLAMLMVIIGGDRVFWGPALGAFTVVLLEHYSSLYAPARWPLILGSIFVLAVMFLRGGISIHLVYLWKRVRHRYGSDQT